ncbi:hypothetical protein BofuT4_uP031440.1 [Botrytis cinerea T4]|uniref:Uncharacterized protein n=1 Tax=Botryotinia fuckeliana (strain T4) TaxID=999810 RepID=G2Y9J2_BOTF4|nr:hypothetical protein BofuT4_uP031440.1 [Botrytis cinerea T4]
MPITNTSPRTEQLPSLHTDSISILYYTNGRRDSEIWRLDMPGES